MTKVSEWCGQRGAEGEHCHGRLRPPQAVWRDLCAFPRLPGMSAQGWLRNRCSQSNGRAQRTVSNPSGKWRCVQRHALSKHPSRRRSRGDDNPPLLREPCRRRRDGDSETASYPCPSKTGAPHARAFCEVVWVTCSLRHAQACKRQGLIPEGPRP